MKQKNKKFYPPTIFYMLVATAILAWFFIPFTKNIFSPLSLIGIVPIFIGVFLNVWADSYFKKHKTTVKPDKKPSKLLKSGPFSVSRHPMYLGMMLILTGGIILLGSFVLFIIPIIFVVIIELYFIPVEERNLKVIFKEDFRNYKKHVRRWI